MRKGPITSRVLGGLDSKLISESVKANLQCALCFLLSCFCLLPVYLFAHCFLLPEIKTDELRKKYVTRNIIVNKIVHKEAKRQKQKQETGNKEHIVGFKWTNITHNAKNIIVQISKAGQQSSIIVIVWYMFKICKYEKREILFSGWKQKSGKCKPLLVLAKTVMMNNC